MRFSIVGAGALGTILGAHLLAAGHQVRILARGERAQYLAANGLQVRGLRELRQPCVAVDALDPASDDDVLVYAVKTYHMADALAAADGVHPRSVFSLANGVMKHDQLVERFGADAVLGCMANFSGELEHDGTALFTRNVCVYLGGHEPRASEIAEVIDQAGIVCKASERIASVEWSKYVGWMALFTLSIIARTPTGTFLSNRRFAGLATSLVREAAAIAGARGIVLADQSPLPVASVANLPLAEAIEQVIATGRDFLASAPQHRMSSLQDLEAGRRLEVHETLGYAVREAARLGLAAPALQLCYEIATGLDELPR